MGAACAVNGKWMSLWPLFGHRSTPRHPMIIQNPPPPRSIRIRALEIRDLVRVGELSRAVARAEAAQLARPSASTISCLSKLHPPPQTQIPCPRVDILPPSLALPTHPLSNSLIEQIMTHKLPFSSRPQHSRPCRMALRALHVDVPIGCREG